MPLGQQRQKQGEKADNSFSFDRITSKQGEYSQIAAKIEPVINEAMVKKFVAYLDVSEIAH
jgi:hypothetical protein